MLRLSWIGCAVWSPLPPQLDLPTCTTVLFPAFLQVIFERSKEFGGGLFALAASVVADLIHHDPLCYRTLDEAGLPQVGEGYRCASQRGADSHTG